MKLELNSEGLQSAMELWRKAIDMEIPLVPHLRSHFLLQRGSLLAGFRQDREQLAHGAE